MALLRRCSSALALLVLASLVALTGCGQALEPGPRQVLEEAQLAGLESGTVGNPVAVALVDGGVDAAHALDFGVVDRWRAPGLDSAPSLHATQMAGIVAGRSSSTYGGGIAPSALILDAKALDATGVGQPRDVAAALLWAEDRDADVVLLSLSLDGDHSEVRSAVRSLVASGAVVVAAAGNGFEEADVYPASYPGVLSVTAYDRAGGRLALAHWRGADVAAPGQDVLAPQLGSGFAPVSGTSVAAAVAAGLVAACGDHRPLAPPSGALAPRWVQGAVIHEQRAVPRLACPTE